ncbi:PIG-L deacetylase family protein [Kineococcus sp. SYSU DK005]|uniref:PIG-L deacetylase family protein n=1 Tax=Kineococcus sp. SYSU DK005 TaxID=3383126 RepID=UPI003D7EB38C
MGRAAARPVQAAVRSAWARRGRPLGERELAADCVVVAPHPDDETLGCGATIARKVRAGARVRVVVATDGRASHEVSGPEVERLVARRRDEAVRACAALGVAERDLVFLDLVDGQLARSTAALRDGLGDVLRAEPTEQLLITPPCDGHPDHDVVAGVVAGLLPALPGPAPRVLQYPVWLWQHWPFTRPRAGAGPLARLTREPLRRVLEVRPLTVPTAELLERKLAALACYESQVGDGADASLPGHVVRPFLGRHEFLLPDGALDHLGVAR